MVKKKVMSFFAGVGGIDLAFESTGQFEVVYVNEFDSNAIKTYEANFDVKVDSRSIVDVNHEDVPDAEVLLAGFPCQAFSVAGYRKGFEDERGSLFFELLRIIKHKLPSVIVIENVKNMVTHDGGNTFNVIKESLQAHGYHLKWRVLNSKDFGNIPQNRERIYIVGFQSKEAFNQFEFPNEIKLSVKLQDVIDFNNKQEEYFYYSKEKNPTFYDQLENEITDDNTVYQWRRKYVRSNKNGVVPTLTANMGTGGHNVPLILAKHGIRKLTPRETFNVQGFPKDYVLPTDMARSHLYKQAGNSVTVPVLKKIAEQILIAYDEVNVMVENQRYSLTHNKLRGSQLGETTLVDSNDSLK